MEIWQIAVICILMFPLFLIANYIIVKKAASERRRRDERIERPLLQAWLPAMQTRGWPAELAQVQGEEEEEKGVRYLFDSKKIAASFGIQPLSGTNILSNRRNSSRP